MRSISILYRVIAVLAAVASVGKVQLNTTSRSRGSSALCAAGLKETMNGAGERISPRQSFQRMMRLYNEHCLACIELTLQCFTLHAPDKKVG